MRMYMYMYMFLLNWRCYRPVRNFRGTLLRMVATLLSFGALLATGALLHFEDEGYIVSVGRPAFLMLLPSTCTSDACQKMHDFWQELGGHAPSGMIWQLVCGSPQASGVRLGGGWTDSEMACRGATMSGYLANNLPAVSIWNAERGWHPYDGVRSLEALLETVRLAALAGAPHTTQPPPNTYSHQPVAQQPVAQQPVAQQPVTLQAGGRPPHSGQSHPPLGDSPLTKCLLAAFREQLRREQRPYCDGGLCNATAGGPLHSSHSVHRAAAAAESKAPSLRPADAVATLPIYRDFTDGVVLLPGGVQLEDEGRMVWRDPMNVTSTFSVLPAVARPSEVTAIRTLLASAPIFDTDPDSVDGTTSHEMFVFDGSPDSGGPSLKTVADPARARERQRFRERLDAVMQPILQERLTPYVRQRFAEQCGQGREEARRCTPCYSLVRRYLPNERRSMGAHYDGHALVTVVVSLSDHGAEYTGGLYVSAGGQQQVRAVPCTPPSRHTPPLSLPPPFCLLARAYVGAACAHEHTAPVARVAWTKVVPRVGYTQVRPCICGLRLWLAPDGLRL